MKKLLLLITTAILFNVANAQVMIQPANIHKITNNVISNDVIKFAPSIKHPKVRVAYNKKGDTTRTVTYDYQTSATSVGGSTITSGSQSIHPSSFTIGVYKDATSGKPVGSKTYTHGFGQIMDAHSPWYQDDTMLYYGYNMKWDSLYFPFAYFRNKDTTTVDTLYVYYQSRSADPKYATAAGQGLVPLTFSTSKINTMSSAFDTASLRGLAALKVDTILLTKKDTSSRFFYRGFKVGATVFKKSALGFLAVFKPGKKGSLRSTDTLFDFSVTGKTIIKNNVLFCQFDRETVGQQGVDKTFNFGQFITTPGKDSSKQNPNFCQPYNFNPASILHIRSFFVVTATYNTVGIENNINNNGYGVSNAFPNPAVSGQSLSFDLTLPKAERTTSFVTNLVGQKVGEVSSQINPSGVTRMNINTQTLTPGIYFYSVQVGTYSITKKFTIAN